MIYKDLATKHNDLIMFLLNDLKYRIDESLDTKDEVLENYKKAETELKGLKMRCERLAELYDEQLDGINGLITNVQDNDCLDKDHHLEFLDLMVNLIDDEVEHGSM